MKKLMLVICMVLATLCSVNAGAQPPSPQESITLGPNPVIVTDTVVITDQSSQRERHVGEDVAMFVAAVGAGMDPVWYKDGFPLTDGISAGGGTITGAGNGTPGTGTLNLAIANVGLLDDGTYTCDITGDCGSAISAYITFKVYSHLAGSIITVADVLCLGGIIDKTADIGTTGKAPITYSWYYDNGTGGPQLLQNGTVVGFGVITGAGNGTVDTATNHLVITNVGVAAQATPGYSCVPKEAVLVDLDI